MGVGRWWGAVVPGWGSGWSPPGGGAGEDMGWWGDNTYRSRLHCWRWAWRLAVLHVLTGGSTAPRARGHSCGCLGLLLRGAHPRALWSLRRCSRAFPRLRTGAATWLMLRGSKQGRGLVLVARTLRARRATSLSTFLKMLIEFMRSRDWVRIPATRATTASSTTRRSPARFTCARWGGLAHIVGGLLIPSSETSVETASACRLSCASRRFWCATLLLSGGRNFGDDVLVQDAPSRLDCMGWWWGAIDAVLNSVFRVTLRRPKSSACVSDMSGSWL